MNKTPPPKTLNHPSNLPDRLSMDRTLLSNERTLLAYIRTALTAVIVGISLIKLFATVLVIVIGWAFLGLGILITWWGLVRYQQVKRLVRKMEEEDFGPRDPT